MRKNLIKRLLIIAEALLLVCSVICLVSCGKKNNGGNNGGNNTDKTVDITVSPEAVTVSEYEFVTLTAKVSGSDESVVWSSSDNSVATVNENGLVYGVKQGTAEITAKAGNASAKCAVTVKKTINVPVVKFTDEITVEKSGVFVGELKVLFNGEDVTDESEIVWSLAPDALGGVCDVAGDGKKVTFSGKELGETEFFVAVTAKDLFVNKSVKVKVVESVISVVPTGKAVNSGYDGYTVNLCTAELDGKSTSTNLSFTVYEGSKVVKNAEIVWDTESEFYNPEVATIDGTNGNYTVTKAAVGKTRLDGTYLSSDNKSIKVYVNVVVEKATINLSDHAVIEVENLKEIDVPSEISENVNAVMLGDKNILSSINGGKMSFDKSKLPVKAAELGKKQLTVSTENYNYNMTADVYTLIVSDKSEFDLMRESARRNGDVEHTGVLDGYYLLDNDVEYNGAFTSMTDTGEIWAVNNALKGGTWHNAAKYGFKGVFDGCGYNVNGLTVKPISSSQSGGIIGYMHNDGVFKNASFTNAVVYENNGFICSIGGGLIENVSVSFAQLGSGGANRELDSNSPRRMGAFFPYIGLDSSTVKNCVVNAIGAKIYYEQSSASGLSNIRLGSGANKVENLIVLCDGAYADKILTVSGATNTAKSFGELASDAGCIAATDEFDRNYWTVINGVPLFARQAEKLDYNESVEFVGLPTTMNTGSEIAVKTNVAYSDITIDGLYDGVTYEGGVLKIAETAASGEITLTATSLINGTTDVKTITINYCEKVEVSHSGIMLEQSVTEIDLSFAADYIGNNVSIYYAGQLIGSGAPENGKLTVDLTGVSETGELNFTAYSEKDAKRYMFTITARVVTKIIRNAKDLAAIRITQANIDNDVSIKGIYVLANDIDMQGATIGGKLTYNNSGNVPIYRADFGFLGTFEGQGHTISNLKVTSGGIFGHIGKGALVTNVIFDNVSYEPMYLTALFAVTARGAKFANVKINVSSYAYEENMGYGHGFISSRYMTDCTLINVNINAKGCDVFSIFGFSVLGENKCNNVLVKVKSYSVYGYSSDSHTEEYAITEMKGVKVTLA